MEDLLSTLIIISLLRLQSIIFRCIYFNAFTMICFQSFVIIPIFERDIISRVPIFGALLQINIGCFVDELTRLLGPLVGSHFWELITLIMFIERLGHSNFIYFIHLATSHYAYYSMIVKQIINKIK